MVKGAISEVPEGVSPLVIQMDHGDYGETFGRRGVVISSGGGGTGSCGITPHIGVHIDMVGDHSGRCGMTPHL